MSREPLKLFIGIPLSLRSVRAVSQAAAELSGRSDGLEIRWQAPARYHVTLAYLGWCKPELVPAIKDVVAEAIAGTKPFDMRCRELGAFPSEEKAQVLWAGIDDRMGELGRLATQLDAALAPLGLPTRGREFSAHVTMGRMKKAQSIANLLQEAPVRVFSKTSVEDLILYNSSVESEPSEYEHVAHWTLNGPSA